MTLRTFNERFNDEWTYTGVYEFIRKRPVDVILSGTTAKSVSDKMAVDVHSVSCKIKARLTRVTIVIMT